MIPTDWETVLGGTYSAGLALRWRTVRAWKSRMVIAERIEDLPSPERMRDSTMQHVDARVGETSECRASGAGLEKVLVTLRGFEESEERNLNEGRARGRAKPGWDRAIRPIGRQVKK